VRMENFDGQASSNLVVLIRAEIVTNAPQFQERPQAVIQRTNDTNADPAALGTPTSQFQERLQSIIKREPTGSVENAETLVQDGKRLYEMGKLAEAKVKFNAALALDSEMPPPNTTLAWSKTDEAGAKTIKRVQVVRRLANGSMKSGWNAWSSRPRRWLM